MKRSLNEIEHTSRKAARGCGLPWGVADEVGKAVRWLHVYGIDGVSMLINLLKQQDHHNFEKYSPVNLESPWRGRNQTLSPIAVGMSLCDCLEAMADAEIKVNRVAYPALIAGFLGQTSLVPGQSVVLQWNNIKLSLYRDGLVVEGADAMLMLEKAETLDCARYPFPGEAKTKKPHIGDAEVSVDSWAELEGHAYLTYVKATEESRLSGAGAGLTDND